MRFFFHMYGQHVESLTVYLRTYNTETRLWGRTGNHGQKWIEGCVEVQDNGTYQVCGWHFSYPRRKTWCLHYDTSSNFLSFKQHCARMHFPLSLLSIPDGGRCTARGYANLIHGRTANWNAGEFIIGPGCTVIGNTHVSLPVTVFTTSQ